MPRGESNAVFAGELERAFVHLGADTAATVLLDDDVLDDEEGLAVAIRKPASSPFVNALIL
jgi:hypothetical protein